MDLWVQAGGSRVFAPIAAAVAMAESGGNPDAVNKNTNGSIDRGLWQINSIHGSLSKMDPLANARAAVKISKGGSNWQPWVAFTTGKYRAFLQDVTARSSEAGPGTTKLTFGKATARNVGHEQNSENSLTEAIGGAWDTATAVPRFLSALGDPKTWLRVGEGIVGASAVIGGVVILVMVIADKSGATGAIGKVVGIVGPGGKVAAVAGAASAVSGGK